MSELRFAVVDRTSLREGVARARVLADSTKAVVKRGENIVATVVGWTVGKLRAVFKKETAGRDGPLRMQALRRPYLSWFTCGMV